MDAVMRPACPQTSSVVFRQCAIPTKLPVKHSLHLINQLAPHHPMCKTPDPLGDITYRESAGGE